MRLGVKPGSEQLLDRLADRDQRILVVDRAASPDGAIGDATFEGRALPALGVLGGHDVLVREQQDRFQLR